MYSTPFQHLPPILPPPPQPHLTNPYDGGSSPDSFSAAEKKPSALDFTQRLERKLTEYNASQNVFKRWLFEVISWCVSALCMVAVVAIYVCLKDEPISRSRSSMLLTIANGLGKVASAALIVPISEALGQLKWTWFHDSKAMWDFEIFDKATRGPWGALMLLFRTRCRSLAALGALLIVLLLAIDTFFQQVVSMSTRWMPENTKGTLPMSIRYKPDIGMVFMEGVELLSDDKDFFHVLEKFAYGNGTQKVPFGTGTRPDIPVSCPTGNCTWPIYDTLSVCSQCSDVSNYLTFTCLKGRVEWTSALNGGFGQEGGFPNATMCGYFLNATSEIPVLMSGYIADSEISTNGEALLTRMLPLTQPSLKNPMYGNGSIQFKELRNTITDVLIVSAPDGSAASILRNATPIAHECVLFWCVQRMRSSYGSGEYIEEVLETFINTTAGPWPWIATPYSTGNDNGTDVLFLQDIDINMESGSDTNQIVRYGTSKATHTSVVSGFTDFFPSFTTATNATSMPMMRYKTWNTGPAWTRKLEFNPWLAPNNVSQHMDRFAAALTNVVRSAPSKTMLMGPSFNTQTYIAISWSWLAFPFTLLLLSLAFLVATMMKTSKDGEIGAWKTSTMPALIYGLPQDVREELYSSYPKDSATSRKGARKLKIRLLPDQGWRVSRQLRASPTFARRTEYREQAGWI